MAIKSEDYDCLGAVRRRMCKQFRHTGRVMSTTGSLSEVRGARKDGREGGLAQGRLTLTRSLSREGEGVPG